MSTALVIKEPSEIWKAQDIDLIHQSRAKDTTDSEFRVFMLMAAKYGLDPLVGQIWCNKFPKKDGGFYPAQIFVGYHGLLEIANREDRLVGMETRCTYDDKGNLTGAIATVWKKGCDKPFVAEVDLDEYSAPYKNPLWKTPKEGGKPKTMIKKVAAVQALRMAFNLSGLYIPEEFDSARPIEIIDNDTGEVVRQPAKSNVVQMPVKAQAPLTEVAVMRKAGVNIDGQPKSEGDGKMSKAAFAGWLCKMHGLAKGDTEGLKTVSIEMSKCFGHETLTALVDDYTVSTLETDPYRAILRDYITLKGQQDQYFGWYWDAETELPTDAPEDLPL
jgi:phage recombination protein Bet